MVNSIKKSYKGFVPAFFPHTQTLCAYYHCKKEREEGRRWCSEHAKQYDCEALEGECKILDFVINEI